MFRTGFCVNNKVCQRKNDMFVGNCEELIERCIQNCLVCLGACRTRRCLVVLQCVVHLLGVPVKPPPDVLFILRSLSCLLSGLQECDKLTSCSSDDCSPVLICCQPLVADKPPNLLGTWRYIYLFGAISKLCLLRLFS